MTFSKHSPKTIDDIKVPPNFPAPLNLSLDSVLIKGVFDFVNEKYEASSKGLLPFRTPTTEEQTFTEMIPPPLHRDSIRIAAKLPHAIEYYEDGLNDITKINKDWETFKESHENITCERIGETEFKVCITCCC